jgi:EAL domain-containing protein (putative c-di-GMP-specific phosphodiesterase class I)
LIRWNHPTRGLVPPADFIPLAEETGLIVQIGEWVVREVCAQLRRWHDSGLSSLCAAINISAPQLQQPTFTNIVVEALERNSLAPQSLQIEITESVAVQNIDVLMQVLRALKNHGVGIAIDDFGTGQSSLVYLRRFPIDTVKIDKTFVNDVTTDDSAAAIVSYVINLAHTLRFQVVAEGVETEAQYNFLRLNACDKLQGYLFSAALPAAEVEEFFKRAQGAWDRAQ